MKKGFTLIELIIVVAILGILGSIFVPRVMPFLFSEKTFKLSNGEIVKCKVHMQDSCGMTLSSCANGNEYKCQTNIVRIMEK